MWKVLLLIALVADFNYVTCNVKCGANERYVACPDTMCIPRNCSQRGYPVPCPILGPEGNCPGKPACICIENYLRDDSTGVCIPSKKCKSPPVTIHTTTEVDNDCESSPVTIPTTTEADNDCESSPVTIPTTTASPVTIPTTTASPVTIPTTTASPVTIPTTTASPVTIPTTTASPVTIPTTTASPVTIPTTTASPVTIPTTTEADCHQPPTCGKNEKYNNCTNTGCQPYLCSELGFPLDCDKKCKPGCICKDGYVRDDKRNCIPIKNCQSCGGDKNATSGCGNNCGKTCATYNKKPVVCTLACRLNGCDCRDGYVYDPNVKACVSPKDCTPTCKANEEYSSCINGGCGPKNCSQLGDPPYCVRPVTCIKGCICADGYLRAPNGTCVLKEQCPPRCTGQNEYFEKCIQGCSNQSCSDIDKKFNCPNQPAGVCKSGCRCNTGFWRNASNICVPQNQCPKPDCPEGEVWNWCPAIKCDGDYCAKTKDSPQTCPIGIVCDKPRCVCGINRKRDWKTHKCIPIKDCPPICKVNEQYSPCANGGCGPKNCSQLGDPWLCVDPVSCTKGCICADGYLRAPNGTCVLKEQCPPRCTGQNEYFEKCIQGCSNQSCSDIDKKFNCPNQPAGVCKSGCRCKDGFWRNASNICVPQNQCPKPDCPEGEVWNWCPAIKCDGDYCAKTKDSPQTCPIGIVCDKPRCVCGINRKRDWKTHKCIPIKDCPPICKVNEQYSPCANGGCGPKNCSQLGDPWLCVDPVSCTKGCICADGYLRAPNGTCVLKEQCPPRCTGQNEYFEKCIQGCSNQSCVDIDKKFNCPNQPAGVCKSGCRCNTGFWRNASNICVPQNQCPKPDCPEGEVWSWCPAIKCDGDYCAKTKDSPQTCPIGIVCDKPRCVCGINRKRDWKTHKCIPIKDCPPICKVNEQYSPCANGGCGPKNCSQLGDPWLCVDPVSCTKGCICADGYLRAPNGTCVLKEQCPPRCTGQNEYFEKCIQGCSNQSCVDIDKKFNCPNQPAGVCKSGCRCNTGFWRNASNICVPQNQCPKPDCPEGELWDWCPAIKCDGDYCAKTKDSPQTCPIGIVCDKPRCVCGINRKRDWKTHKCIPIKDCPPFKCGDNEKYQPCPAACPGEKCSDFINKSKCPAYKIGVVVNCRPQCKCIKGYYRNADGCCVPACECEKTASNQQPDKIIQNKIESTISL